MSDNLANFIGIFYLVILLITAILGVVLAWLGLSRLSRPGALAFVMRALVTAFYAVTYLISLVTPNVVIARFAAEIRIPFIPLAHILTLFFVIEFTGRRISVPNWLRAALLLPIALTPLGAGVLDDAFYQQFEQRRLGVLFIESSTYGLWSLILLSYSIIVVILTGSYLLWVFNREQGEQRTRAAWLLAATVLSVLPGTLNLLLADHLVIDITPLGSWFALMIYGWLFARHHLLDVVPFALDSVLRSMEDGVLVVNPRGLIAQFNPAAARLLGRADTELFGQSIALVLPGLSPDTTMTDFQIVDQLEGKQRWLDLRVSPAYNIQGQRVGQVYVLRDSTEKHRLQRALTEQAALQAALQKEQELSQIKTQMMIRIAHEFRTPLATIQLFSELLERYLDRMTPEQRSERVAVIRSQIALITDMLDDITTALRGEFKALAIRPEPFDLVALARERVERMNGTTPERRPIDLVTAVDTLTVTADRALIDMALRCLLANAIKYSPIDGPIALDLREEDSAVVLQVRDQGIGIPPDEQEYIFEPFYRASNIGEISGLGIGLSLARDAIRSHGGAIAVVSAPGKGSTFTVRLPRHGLRSAADIASDQTLIDV
ncbi:MAG: ATP-binding protein [Candidatus Flexifilum sp.]